MKRESPVDLVSSLALWPLATKRLDADSIYQNTWSCALKIFCNQKIQIIL